MGMKSLDFKSADFNFEDQKELTKMYCQKVYTETSDKIRNITRVARGGLGNCDSHERMGEMVE